MQPLYYICVAKDSHGVEYYDAMVENPLPKPNKHGLYFKPISVGHRTTDIGEALQMIRAYQEIKRNQPALEVAR